MRLIAFAAVFLSGCNDTSSGGSSRGLVNLGNTCYFNSVMQLLLNAPPVIAAATELAQFPKAESGSIWDSFLNEFLTLMNERWNSSDSKTPMNPEGLFRSLSQMDPDLFALGIQQDADEALTSIYENLKEAIRVGFSGEMRAVDFFNALTSNRAVCIEGGRVVAQQIETQNRMIVSLPQDATDPVTLESCIGRIFNTVEVEKLDSCPPGESKSALLTPLLRSFPTLLLVTARRSIYGKPKINTKVRVPLELDLSSLPRDEDTPISPKYHLIGIVHHHGPSVSSGHYTAEYKDPQSHEWYSANDSIVKRISGPSNDSSTAYLFLYLSS